MKPFTFSVYFPDGSKYQNDGFLVGNNVVMKFTTNQIELLTTVVNGVQNISKQPYPFFNNALKLDFIRVHPLKKIDSSEIKFKTISPILVTNKNCHVDIDGKQYDLYLEPGEDGFDEGLYFLIKEQVRQLLNYDNSFPLEY
ncbi:MAG: hypothetical protein NC934_07415, partial [Candidatus Omnitrophica bacterium]|nr:hypothetical protein [Candidatus Omnitrophota bacterium]